MRRVLFWLHLVCGLTAGLVILMMALTGTLLMYEKQMTAWADGYVVALPTTERPISIQALIEAGAAHRHATPTALTLHADRTRPATLSFGREGAIFLNPHTGEILGEGSAQVRAFFRATTQWHRWLSLEGQRRAAGRAVTAGANLLFLLVIVSGLIIWWPKAGTVRALRSILWFRPSLSGKARDFNWHNVTGFWIAAPLSLMVVTALPMSYPWANDLLYRLTGNQPPARREAPVTTPPGQKSEGRLAPPGPLLPPKAPTPHQRSEGDFLGYDALWLGATEHSPEWRMITVRVPESADGPVAFVIDTSNGAVRPDRRAQLFLHRETGRIVRYESYADQNGGRKLRSWARFLHTGEAFGLPGQTVAGLASAGVLVLGWTGFALSWRRLRAFRARAARKDA